MMLTIDPVGASYYYHIWTHNPRFYSLLAIDPVGAALAKKELADAKGLVNAKPFKAKPGPKGRAKKRAPSVGPSERDSPVPDSGDESSDVDEEAAAELHRKLEKEKSRLERAERSHAKIAAYRQRRQQEQQEMADADARLEQIKKQNVDHKRDNDRRLRAQKKEEVRLWREQEETRIKDEETAKERDDIVQKRERQRMVAEYLERREKRDKKKKVEMEHLALDNEEEALQVAEIEAVAKKESDEKRKKQAAARKKKAAEKKAAEDEVRSELEKEAATAQTSPAAVSQTTKREQEKPAGEGGKEALAKEAADEASQPPHSHASCSRVPFALGSLQSCVVEA